MFKPSKSQLSKLIKRIDALIAALSEQAQNEPDYPVEMADCSRLSIGEIVNTLQQARMVLRG